MSHQRLRLPRNLFADLDAAPGADERAGAADPTAQRLLRLGRDIRRDLDPDRWRKSDRAQRIAMARLAHIAICRCLNLPVPSLTFEPHHLGPLISHDRLTERVVGSSLLVADHDPSALLRALVQEHCQRARDRLIRNRRWLRRGLQSGLRGLWRRRRGRMIVNSDELDVLDLEPGDAARQVLEGFSAGEG